MSSSIATARRGKPNRRALVVWAAAALLIVAMALSTKVVKIGSTADVAAGTFSADAYGPAEFPKVQSFVESRAVNAAALVSAIAKNRGAAAKQYGVEASAGTEFPVKFSGLVGKGDFGTYDVTVSGVPKTVAVKVQTGPFISGTDLRDATGTITFSQFKNQIEYQNAGAALNKQMKKDVLSKIEGTKLTGKTISVVGVFLSSDPGNWLVTPVKMDVP
jgi:predicted lipoprotein